MTELEVFEAAERESVRAYLVALGADEAPDWARARKLREAYDGLRLERGLAPDRDLANAYWPPPSAS